MSSGRNLLELVEWRKMLTHPLYAKESGILYEENRAF